MNRAHFALGRLPVGKMNKTELSYATVLEGLKRAGQVQWYRFEGLKLRLADSTFYTPDFAVMRDDGARRNPHVTRAAANLQQRHAPRDVVTAEVERFSLVDRCASRRDCRR